MAQGRGGGELVCELFIQSFMQSLLQSVRNVASARWASWTYRPKPIPLTLHSTPHTLRSTLYTPHSAPHTLHPTLYALHSTPHTLRSTLYTRHPTLYALHQTPHTLRSTPDTQTLELGGLELSRTSLHCNLEIVSSPVQSASTALLAWEPV
eukprot:350190-Chlamydomonas_euryale.AAC.1